MERWHNLQSFVAHSSQINCVTIGRQSHQIIATGGDDKKVNLWVGKHGINKRSLTQGLTSPVTAVCLDAEETTCIAGTEGGGVKVYDLETGKLSRSLPGHMNSVTCIMVHPCKQYVVTGSVDTKVKLWDLNSKSAILTFKSHSAPITCVRFSADGNWVSSASKDGTVFVLDRASHEVVHSFSMKPATPLTFDHGARGAFVAVATSERVVRVYDADSEELMMATTPEPGPVRALQFSPVESDADLLYTASDKGLRVTNVRTEELVDQVDVPWDKVAAISVTRESQVVAASFHSSFLDFWAVDLNAEFDDAYEDRTASRTGADDDGPPWTSARDSSRARGHTPRRRPWSGKSQVRDVHNGERRSPDPPYVPYEQAKGHYDAVGDSGCVLGRGNGLGHVRSVSDSVVDAKPSVWRRGEDGWDDGDCGHVGVGITERRGCQLDSAQRELRGGGGRLRAASPPSRANGAPTPPVSVREDGRPGSKEDTRTQPDAQDEESHIENEVLIAALSHRTTVTSTLSTRLTHLQLLGGMWGRGDVTGAVRLLRQLQNGNREDGGRLTVAADFLRVVDLRSDALTLDIAIELVPVLNGLLEMSFENHVAAGLKGVETLLRMYGDYLRQVRSAPVLSGVDLKGEERLRKCHALHQGLNETYSLLSTIERVFKPNSPVYALVGRVHRQLQDYMNQVGHRLGSR